MPANFLEKYKVPRIVLGLFIFFVCLFLKLRYKKKNQYDRTIRNALCKAYKITVGV